MATKNAFTKGDFKVVPEPYSRYSKYKLCYEASNGTGPIDFAAFNFRADADFACSAFNSATALAEMGYDGQAAIEALPEFLTLLQDPDFTNREAVGFLLKKAKGKA